MRLTKHSIKRGRERIGISKDACQRTARKALEYGVAHAETRGGLNRFLTALYFDRRTANNIRVYNRFVYLFSGDKLITIIALPRKYYDVAEKLQKAKNGFT